MEESKASLIEDEYRESIMEYLTENAIKYDQNTFNELMAT
jgi:hypothetical protein